MKKRKGIIVFAIFLASYFLFNILFLDKFPFIHTDEAWLSGLSRNIYEKRSFKVTESFFDLLPRFPHGIKSLFHLIQIIFMKFGYSIFTFRLISLFFSTISLFIFYKILNLFTNKTSSLLCTILLSVDSFYIYSSHFARQEIILVFFSLLSIYTYFSMKDYKFIKDIILGTIIGISIGIHPNSFIISLPILFMYIGDIFLFHRKKIGNILVFTLTLSLFASFYILFSFLLDNNFIFNYLNYGSQYDVLSPLETKFGEIFSFYGSLFKRSSGTYFIPNISFSLYLFLSLFLLSFLFIGEKNEKRNITLIFLCILGINIGIILIGRFNQTSIIFIFPLFYLLLLLIIKDINYKNIIISFIILVNISFSIYNILPFINNSYDTYLSNISSVIPKESLVLGSLTLDYYLNNNNLFDFRNLYYLKENNLTFSSYIKKNRIEYIVYPEELDYIYRNRPTFDGLYGNLYYYDDMNYFLQNNCSKVLEFENKTYGNRISSLINKKNWKIKIYKVN